MTRALRNKNNRLKAGYFPFHNGVKSIKNQKTISRACRRGKEDLLQWSELEDEEDLSELFDSHLVLDDSLKPAFRTTNS